LLHYKFVIPDETLELMATSNMERPLEEDMWVDRILSVEGLWVHHILPFVGMGNFAFVAGVNRQWKGYCGGATICA
jgi:hypothetical protein